MADSSIYHRLDSLSVETGLSPGVLLLDDLAVLHYTLPHLSGTKLVVLGFEAVNGRMRWRMEVLPDEGKGPESAHDRAAAAGGRIFVTTDSGRAGILSPQTGQCEKWLWSGLKSVHRPVVQGEYLGRNSRYAGTALDRIEGGVFKNLKFTGDTTTEIASPMGADENRFVWCERGKQNPWGALKVRSLQEPYQIKYLAFGLEVKMPAPGVAPVVGGGQVYVAGAKGTVAAFSTTQGGKKLWEKDLGADIETTPVLVPGTSPRLACATANGMLFILDPSNGSGNSYDLRRPVVTHLETAGGRLFFGTQFPDEYIWSYDVSGKNPSTRSPLRAGRISPHIGARSEGKGTRVHLVTRDAYEADDHFYQQLWFESYQSLHVKSEPGAQGLTPGPPSDRFEITVLAPDGAIPGATELEISSLTMATVSLDGQPRPLNRGQCLRAKTGTDGRLVLEVKGLSGPPPPLFVRKKGMAIGEAAVLIRPRSFP